MEHLLRFMLFSVGREAHANICCLDSEVLNRRALEAMLAREEEVKKKAIVQKAIYSGPQIRYHSKDGMGKLRLPCFG